MATSALIALLTPTPTTAQRIDFTGGWTMLAHENGPERLPGSELANYAGMPVNDAARMRGETYDPNRNPERKQQ